MAAVTGFDRSLTEEKLHDAEQRLSKSLQQILVIDAQIRELEILYKRAQKSKKNASRYNLRLKLSVVSGECWLFCSEWLIYSLNVTYRKSNFLSDKNIPRFI